MNNSQNLLEELLRLNNNELQFHGKFGIERESLRVKNNKISQVSHKRFFGSPLCNDFITTDFSEALIEIITPPLSGVQDGIDFLDDLHHFVAHKIEDELLWPFSIPPYIDCEDDIKIAKYGASNQGLFKVLYRNGLAFRYGRLMQSIAGVHYNYSFPRSFWQLPVFVSQEREEKKIKELVYFRALRNINRYNWLILYLYGASPFVTRNFKNADISGLKKIKDGFFLKDSTSLRMSGLGYQPESQAHLKISLNSIDKYTDDLINATLTNSINYSDTNLDGFKGQISPNILQIEDEYYSVVRPKSSSTNKARQTSNLLETGIDYIELRSLDLNPFSSRGITKDTVVFLQAFILFCALSPSPNISSKEAKEIRKNNQLVSSKGRRKNLLLRKSGKDIFLKDWAYMIIDEIEKAGSLFNISEDVLLNEKAKIEDPDKTISGMIMTKLRDERMGFHELANFYAIKNKKFYMDIKESSNKNWKDFKKECEVSIGKQKSLELQDRSSLDQYIHEYFSN